MKLFIFSIAMLVGMAFTVGVIDLLKSLVNLIIPSLANYPIVSIAIAFGIIIGICLLVGKIAERCAVEYPYDDRM